MFSFILLSARHLVFVSFHFGATSPIINQCELPSAKAQINLRKDSEPEIDPDWLGKWLMAGGTSTGPPISRKNCGAGKKLQAFGRTRPRITWVGP
jgi:hypothetical protein